MKYSAIAISIISAIMAATQVFAAEQAAQVKPETYSQAYNEGLRLRNAKKPEEAAAAAQRAFDLAQTPDQKSGALWLRGDAYLSAKDTSLLEKYMLEAAAVEGASPQQRFNCVKDVMNKGFAKNGAAGLEKAKDLYASFTADPVIATNASFVTQLAETVANISFNGFKADDGAKLLEGLEKTAAATPADRARLACARGRFAARMNEYEEACRQFARAHADKDVSGNDRMYAFEQAAKYLSEDIKYDEIIALGRKYLADPAFVCQAKERRLADIIIAAQRAKKDFAAARATLDAFAATRTDDARYAREISNEVERLGYLIDYASGDFYACLKRFQAKPNTYRQSSLREAHDLCTVFYPRGDYTAAVSVASIYLKGRKINNWYYRGPMNDAIVSYWRMGDKEGAIRFIDQVNADFGNPDDSQTISLNIVRFYLEKGKLTLSDVKKILGKAEGRTLTEALARAARLLIRFDLYEEPKMIYDYRQTFIYNPPRNMAAVRYVKNAPTDVGSWHASGLMTEKEKHVCNHKVSYSNAEQLVTDVNTQRGDVTKNVEKDAPEQCSAWFWVCYDEYGIHLYFEHYDTKYQDVHVGKVWPCGYEMYFGIGELGAAYQFGINPTKTKYDYCPDWNSPSKYFRSLEKYSDFNSRQTEHGYGTAMNISWELVYNCLPENGDEWPFEMICWSRSGGLTWGGDNIWQRSNWGHWKFEGFTPQVRSAMHRVLIYKALGRYNAQKNFAIGGSIGYWPDPELGDPVFFEKELKPLVEKLDAYAEEAKGEISDALADKLFKEAVPLWYDFRFEADARRKKYLRNSLTD